MKAKYAKELLQCSYTTLHNYVKQGKLRLAENPISSKQQEYDDLSVYDLADKIKGSRKPPMTNDIIISTPNEKFIFSDVLNEHVQKIVEWLKVLYSESVKY